MGNQAEEPHLCHLHLLSIFRCSESEQTTKPVICNLQQGRSRSNMPSLTRSNFCGFNQNCHHVVPRQGEEYYTCTFCSRMFCIRFFFFCPGMCGRSQRGGISSHRGKMWFCHALEAELTCYLIRRSHTMQGFPNMKQDKRENNLEFLLSYFY